MLKTILLTALVALATTLCAQVEGFEQQGNASFYADKFEGRTTASGERYSHKKATCAHLSLPFGTLVKVTNLQNGKTAVARVNDRGPFVSDRIIDLSKSVAQRLDFVNAGVTAVKIEAISSEGDAALATDSPKISEKPSPKQPDGDRQPKTEKPAISPVNTVSTTDVASTGEAELFDIDIEKVDLKGYSVQIGSYKELASVLRIAADVEKALGEKAVRIQVTSLKGERVYRIMVGEFASAKDARKFKDKAAKIYSDCFVVNLNQADNSKASN